VPERCTYGETLLKIDHVSLSYEDKVILRDVNAEIRDIVREGRTQGQVVGFLGPSGIGKTQLFRIIAAESPHVGTGAGQFHVDPRQGWDGRCGRAELSAVRKPHDF